MTDETEVVTVASVTAIHAPTLNRIDSPADSVDFSLVLGGPLYQVYRRARLTGSTLELVYRRVAAIVILTWLPLLLLAVAAGPAGIAVPFWRDCDAQARFLVALPLLVAGELVVHKRTRGVMRNFLDRAIVSPADTPRFLAEISSVIRVRNSTVLEIALLIFTFTVGQWSWRTQNAGAANTWYGVGGPGGWHLTPAGYWLAFVAIPAFQFILLRWYLRMLLWAWLLWRVSRLPLHITCTHPDRAGGLGFLGKSAYAFAPILGAQGALLAGLVGNRVLYQGATLLSFKVELVALIGVFMVVVLGPLTVFARQMLHAKHRALGEYGLLANEYVRGFEQRWLGSNREDAELLGSSDIQSLADLAGSYDIIREMRIVPFGLHDVSLLAAATAVPLAPLALTVVSLDELVGHLLQILF